MNPDPVYTDRYSAPARIMHWIAAGAIAAQWYLGWAADTATNRDEGARLIFVHFRLGVAIFVLMSLRLTWRSLTAARLTGTPPPKSANRAAGVVHVLLYALVLTLPISGYVMWIWMDGSRQLVGGLSLPRLFTPPGEDEYWRAVAWYVHHYSAYLLGGLAILHIVAASWHEFVLRDRLILRRMT